MQGLVVGSTFLYSSCGDIMEVTALQSGCQSIAQSPGVDPGVPVTTSGFLLSTIPLDGSGNNLSFNSFISVLN